VDGNNAILVTDQSNHRVRKIAGEGARVTTLAGSSEAGKVDGEGARSRFNLPFALALDERGRLLVAEINNDNCLRVGEVPLAPPKRLAVEPILNPPSIALEDYGKLLEDTAGLYEHCVGQFREGMQLGTAMQRLVQAHISVLEVLEKTAMEYVVRNYHAI
jgi:hypothetical protein